MSKAVAISTRECDFSAIKIPPIAKTLSRMRVEILNASLLLSRIQEVSLSLKETIQKSNFVESDDLREADALVESSFNLKLVISEIQERMTSLEVSLSRNAIIPDNLSNADDLSVALDIAVNGFIMEWPLAETVLERYLFLKTEELDEWGSDDSSYNVWEMDGFESNFAKLLKAGDCWRVRKSLELFLKMLGDKYDCGFEGSTEIFESLASIILQPNQGK
jgi:hypothetical protein